MNVYYPNAILLLIPGIEAIVNYRRIFKQARCSEPLVHLAGEHLSFLVAVVVALLPTFVSRQIIYGNAFESDYPSLRTWYWTSPALFRVLFSADHGLLSWTPILLPAVLGLVVFWRKDHLFGGGLLLSFLTYYYFIASYPDWDGISSFGNRFFVSLTPIFVLGLAAFLDFFSRSRKHLGSDFAVASSIIGLLVLWDCGFIFQWGTGMVPARGPIAWSEMIHNQYAAVPRQIGSELEIYFTARKTMMQRIEGKDLEYLKTQPDQLVK